MADTGAAEALYQRHSLSVFRYCLSRLGRREDAEDAVQTTFLHAVRGLRRGVVPAVEAAWLLGIARNVCRSRWEAAGRRDRVEWACDPLELERAGAAPYAVRDELIGVEEALARLPEQQRRAVLLRDWRGLSYEEVAAQLGVSVAAVETLIFRGRRTLAELLREEPATTRRRLASLGNVGSLFTYAKAAFTGAAAATKLAAAICVVAVSSAGIAVGSSVVREGGSDASVRVGGQPAAAVTPASAVAGAPAADSPALATAPGRTAKTSPRLTTAAPVKVAPASSAQTEPSVAAGTAPASPGPRAATPTEPSVVAGTAPASPGPSAAKPSGVLASAAPLSGADGSAPTRASAPPQVLPAVTTAVEEIAGAVLPAPPVSLPALPQSPVAVPALPALPAPTPPVDDVVGALPPVPPVPIPPVEVALPPVQLPNPPKLP